MVAQEINEGSLYWRTNTFTGQYELRTRGVVGFDYMARVVREDDEIDTPTKDKVLKVIDTTVPNIQDLMTNGGLMHAEGIVFARTYRELPVRRSVDQLLRQRRFIGGPASLASADTWGFEMDLQGLEPYQYAYLLRQGAVDGLEAKKIGPENFELRFRQANGTDHPQFTGLLNAFRSHVSHAYIMENVRRYVPSSTVVRQALYGLVFTFKQK